MKPTRVQLRRTKGWRKPEGTVVVARPTKWGNPFPFGTDDVPDRAASVAKYREWIMRPEQAELRAAARDELAGKPLACYCPLDGPCHADVLIEIANGE